MYMYVPPGSPAGFKMFDISFFLCAADVAVIDPRYKPQRSSSGAEPVYHVGCCVVTDCMFVSVCPTNTMHVHVYPSSLNESLTGTVTVSVYQLVF